MTVLFTSESVSEGHPDKLCDAVSDALLDLCLTKDPAAHTAIETLATTNRIVLAGEISMRSQLSPEEIEHTVRKTVRDIGYIQPGFDWQKLQISNFLHAQSADIASGIGSCGAGDQGIMFGYAKNEPGFDCCYMPLALKLSHRILESLNQDRRAGLTPGLEPDAKSQVTVEYQDRRPTGISKIVVSAQHSSDLSLEDVRNLVLPHIRKNIPDGWLPDEKNILINPAGRFVIGGPDGDTGLTGRKIIVDTYGGYAPHGGGAFSGKDSSKVDRSAAYMLRYLAKNIVAAGLADECLLQISYAIGLAEPLSLFIDTRGTAKINEQHLLDFIRKNFDLTPCGIRNTLQLQKPIYRPTAAYGHFGRTPGRDETFSWEKLDLIGDFQSCL